MRLVPYAAFALLACAAPRALTAEPTKEPVPMKTVFFRDLTKERVDGAVARAAVTPAELTFALDGEPHLQGSNLVVTGVLTNATDQDVPIVVFPTVNWANPFYLRMKVSGPIRYRPASPGLPPPPPPAPPPPMRVVVPAQSRLVFEGTEDLSKFTWTGTPEATIDWTLLFWNPPKPAGTLTFRLPEPAAP